MNQTEQTTLTGREVALLTKMAIFPMKVLSQLSPVTIAEATARLIEKGQLQPEDMPSPEDLDEIDALAVKLGLPPDGIKMS